MLKDVNCPVYINRELTTRTTTPQDLINTTVMIRIYYQHSSWEGLRRKKRRSCCCHLLSAWLNKGEMGDEMFLTALGKRRKLLLWPNQEGRATCLSWQLKYSWAQSSTNCTRPKRKMGPSKSVLLLEVKHFILFKGTKNSALPCRWHQPISTQCKWARQYNHVV